MRKIILIIIIVIGILGVLLFFYVNKSKEGTETPIYTPTPTTSNTASIPSGNTLEIGGLTMNNFYNTADKTTKNGGVTIAETSNYYLTYSPNQNYFLITILASPFPQARIDAENAFIKKLGIDKQDACRLNVNVGTPLSVNPDYAGNLYKLSFCK